MRFERFKTFADMLAYAVKTAAAYAPGSIELDAMAYSEESAKRPQVSLYLPDGEIIALRWFAYADEESIDFYGKRARVEANEAGQAFAVCIREALATAAAVDLRRAPFEELGEAFPVDVCRVTARNEAGNRVNYQTWVFATDETPPAVGDVVEGVFNRLGSVKVTGYFREGGYVGIKGYTLNAPEHLVKQNKAESFDVYLFPTEYRKAPAAPAGWQAVEGGVEGTSLEDVDAKAAVAMANPGTAIELFEGCTMIALGSPADVVPAAAMLAEALGETLAPPPAPALPRALAIVKRSLEMHPSLFREAIQARKTQDERYAAEQPNPAIARSVKASADAAARALSVVDFDTVETIRYDMAAGIIALNIACKLQCLPRHEQTAAAVETWGDQTN